MSLYIYLYLYIYIYIMYVYVYIYIYTHTYTYIHVVPRSDLETTANLRTKLLGFKGFDSSMILMIKGCYSHVHREISGYLQSMNLSRDNLSR